MAEEKIKLKSYFKWGALSSRQKKVLCWWHKDSPYANYNGIIADGAIRSGKTVSMAFSFVIWAMSSYDRYNFAMCGKTIGYLKCPTDSREDKQIMGVPITYGSDETIRDLHDCLNDMRREYRLKQPFVGADDRLFGKDSNLPENGLFKKFRQNGLKEGSFWEVFDPAIRDSSYLARFQQLCGILESSVGVSPGILTKAEKTYVTDDEIKQQNSDTFAMIDAIRENIETAFQQTAYALDVLAEFYGATPAGAMGDWQLIWDWDYSMMESSTETFTQLSELESGNAEDSTADSAMVAPDFSDFSTEEYAQKIDELTLILSGALLALGAILAFSGANIPLGIGLMTLGAVGLATEAAMNWNAIVEALRGPIGAIVALASTALLALGLALALSGAAIPLGIGLIVAGAAGLATTAAVNWSTIIQALQGPIGKITAIASAALLALGIILVCTGVIPLGVALIAAGAAGLVTVTAVNWNAIRDKVADVWSGIKQWWQSNVAPIFTSKYWENKFAVMGEALKDTWKSAINVVIELVNKFTAWLNDKLHLEWDAVSIAGVEVIPAVDYQLLSIPRIPKLAQGAVIPPNREFMAVLGDQRHGTNIEAPLETIQEAVAIVMEDMIQSNIAGHEATVAVLKQILEAVLGIHIGDDVIGQAVARYNARMAIIRGGNR